MHEQKFKDLQSNTCQVTVERSILDLESEGSGSTSTRGIILSLDVFWFSHSKDVFWFSHSKDENAIIGISVRMRKTP